MSDRKLRIFSGVFFLFLSVCSNRKEPKNATSLTSPFLFFMLGRVSMKWVGGLESFPSCLTGEIFYETDQNWELGPGFGDGCFRRKRTVRTVQK